MPFIKISGLTTATAVSATNQFEINQNGASRSLEVSVLDSYIRSGSSLPVVVSVSSASAAVRITQTGAGNALVVEDEANPDATPFVVDASGNVGIGETSPSNFTAMGMVLRSGTASTPAIFNWNTTNDTSTASFGFRKDRAGAVVQSGDLLGLLRWQGFDGGSYRTAAQVTGEVDNTPGAGDMPGRLVFSTTADGASSPTERMRIDSTGAIGVGVTPVTQNSFTVTRNIGGAAFSAGIVSDGRVQTTASSRADYFLAAMRISGSVPIIVGYQAQQATHTGTLTDQVGFRADASLIGATNNFGFFGNIPAGANRWNFYAGGTADNYFAGNVLLGTTVQRAIAGQAPEFLIERAAAARAAVVRNTADANGPLILTAKSRGTTNGSYTVVASGDALGTWNFAGSDGTADVIAASIRADVDGTPGSNDMPGRLVFSTTADGAASPTERMRIASTGNVGIGSAPVSGTRLVVAGPTDNPQATATDGGINQYMGYCGFGSAYSGTSTSHPYVLLTNNLERMRITAAGNVGIGTASPSEALTVTRTSGEAILGVRNTGTNSAWLLMSPGSAGTALIHNVGNTSTVFTTNGTERMRIDASGNVGIGTASPGARLDVVGGDIRLANNRGLTFRNFAGTNVATFILQVDDNFVVYNAAGAPVQSFSQAAAPVAAYGADGNHRMSVNASTGTIAWVTAGSERMRVDTNGRVGIGTAGNGFHRFAVREDTNAGATALFSSSSNTAFPGLTFERTRAASTAVQSGDTLGVIQFAGFDGSTGSGRSDIISLVDGATSTGSVPTRMTFSTTPSGSLLPVERMRIDASGRVQIGLTSGISVAGATAGLQTATTAGFIDSLRFTADAFPPVFKLVKSRSATVGTNAAVQSGDALGQVGFVGADGTSYVFGAAITGEVDGTPGTNDMPGRLIFSTTADGAASPTERMRITNAGNVGIGTAAPQDALHVNRASDMGVRIQSTAGAAYLNFLNTTGAVVNNASNTAMVFTTNNAERMRITPAGNVLIGTTGSFADSMLTVRGSAADTRRIIVENNSTAVGTAARYDLVTGTTNSYALWTLFEDGAGGATFDLACGPAVVNGIFMSSGTSTAPIVFRQQTSERMRIATSGEVYIAGTTDQGAYNLQVNGTGVWGAGAYVNGSDARIKDDIAPLTSGLDVVTKLTPVQFRYKESWSKDTSIQPGFIAQDLQAALADQPYKEGVVLQGPEYMSVAYQALIPLLTKAIQEQQSQIETLKARVAALENK